MRGKNVFWGIFFIVMAVIVIASKIGILPDVGIFTILASAVLIWAVVDGIRRRNLYETIFAAAFLLIIYEKALHIEGLTPWTILVAALLFSIGFSILFGTHKKENKVLRLTGIVTATKEWASAMNSAASPRSAVRITLGRRFAILIQTTSPRRVWRIILAE